MKKFKKVLARLFWSESQHDMVLAADNDATFNVNLGKLLVGASLMQRVLLHKKLLQLLLLFLRKLQLFFCQFKEPSVLLAVQDFAIPSKPGHPQATVNIMVFLTVVKKK